ncbi:hypothetical protein ACFLZB_01160 [Nanoarchaeota archaeon]
MKKKKSRKPVYFAIFIIALMIFSGFAIVASNMSERKQFDYNGFEFQSARNLWATEINDQPLISHFHPSELEDINTPNLELLKSPQIYISFDPEIKSEYLDLSRLKLSDFSFKFLNTYPVNGITQESDDYQLPVITCQNATSSTPVVIYQENNQSEINLQDHCLYIKVQEEEDFLKMTERIIYTLAGVING